MQASCALPVGLSKFEHPCLLWALAHFYSGINVLNLSVLVFHPGHLNLNERGDVKLLAYFPYYYFI